MGIFSRLTDIINSNVNAILDRAEDPEKIIRLIVQEMEETLVEVRSTAARTIAEKKEILRNLARYTDAQEEWARKAEVDRLDEALDRNEADIVKLQDKLKEAKAKQKAMNARRETASSRLKVRHQLYDGKIEDAFARFAQMEKRLDATEGEVEAFDLGRKKSLTDEIADLEAESAIEEELEALKARLAKRKGAKDKAE